jgi:hypothetical protein
MPNLQLFANDLGLAFTYLSEEEAGKMVLLPSSVNGVPMTSGRGVDEFGNLMRVGDQPSIPAGEAAKVVAFTLHNKDSGLEHKFRIQIGYQDTRGNFVVRYDSTLFLSKYGTGGDAMLMNVEPFFIPADQLSETGREYFMKRFGHVPENFSLSGTNIIARIATDGSNVPAELSLSLILDP